MRNRQQRSMTCVPDLTLRVFPLHGPGQFVGDDPHVVRALPLPFPVDLHSLLAVDNLVAEHPWKLELVALGRVCVQDHFAILQQLAAQGLPLNLPDGARPGGTLHGDLGLQFAKNQGLGAAALNDARPLLPHHDAIFGLDQVFELHILRYVASVKGSLIGLDVLPAFPVPEHDLLFLLLDVLLPQLADLLLHVLNGLMVDIEKKVDLALGNPVQLEENMSGLHLEGLSLRSLAFGEEWV